jgi:hypothetical protein
MSTQVSPFTVVFPEWYDERAEHEATSKGYLPDVEVRLSNGPHYKLCFFDHVRLGQDLEDQASSGRPYFAEPGLVVVPEVNTESIRKAVAGLWQEGFFNRLRPL